MKNTKYRFVFKIKHKPTKREISIPDDSTIVHQEEETVQVRSHSWGYGPYGGCNTGHYVKSLIAIKEYCDDLLKEAKKTL